MLTATAIRLVQSISKAVVTHKCTMFIIHYLHLSIRLFPYIPKNVINIVTLMHLDIGKMGDHVQKYVNDNDMNLKNSFWKKNIRNLPGR